MRAARLFFGLVVLLAANAGSAEVLPLRHAHAHNDYRHSRPLFEALDNGFCSIEVDVHLIDGKLLVAHSRDEAQPDRTLEKLYLEPLRDRIRSNHGRVYPNGPPIFLFIDFKGPANETWRVLSPLLEQFSEMLTAFTPDGVKTNAVTVILTGNSPRAALQQAKVRLAACDGKIADLSPQISPRLFPVISDNWKTLFQWNGDGPMPGAEREKLRNLVAQAHGSGCRLRLWGAPDTLAVWQELLVAKVDLINTDKLAALARFLTAKKDQP
jgi:hypothetical protein